MMQMLPHCIRRRFEHSELPDAWYFQTEVISNWFTGAAVLIVPTIIVAPMFALYAIPSTWERMAALWGFAVVFAGMTRYLASPNSDVIFATNAAYVSFFLSLNSHSTILFLTVRNRFCAVLVVFVGSALPQ